MFEPIIAAYRVFFLFLYEHIGFALSILITSLITSFLMKPIAKFIMKYVKREQAYQTVLQPQIDAINGSDKSGAEKQFELQELYRRYGYSPILATRKVLPLFVQLPFLFLTYYMLEGTTVLNGVPFLCFKDLGAADALLPLGVNLLPFVMTGINFIAIFSTPSFARKDQIQAIVVALLFLVMLYPASSALMIYWTLNNFFTCVKTLLEEKGEGVKLLAARLRHIISPATHRAWARTLLNRPMQTYATASLVCALLAIHSYIVFSGRYGEASFSGKVTANSMNLFMVLALTFLALVRTCQRTIFLVLAGVLFMIQCGIIGDKLILKSTLAFGKHPIILRNFFYVQVVLFCAVALVRQCLGAISWQHKVSWKECLIFVFAFLAISCHYLCANTLLGLSVSSFVLFSLYLIGIYLSVVGLGDLLFGRNLSLQRIGRVAFVFCGVFYLMPLFVKGTGWFFPAKNIWLYWVVTGLVGFSFGILWAKAKRFLDLFVVLASIALIVNGAYHTLTAKESVGQVVVDQAESYSHLDGHKIVHPYNVFLLVYDGWPNPMIARHYDIYDPLPYLESRGFTVYPRAYMPCADTVNSMSRFFDIFKDTNLPVRDTIAGRAKCLRFLRANNYKMCNLTDEYMLQGTYLPLEGDFFFPDPTGNKGIKIENVLMRNIRHGFLSQMTEDFQAFTHEEKVMAKRAILSEMLQRPKFMYAHSGPGHTITEEKFRRAEEVEMAEFIRRVDVAKLEMVNDLDAVHDWDNSLIIIASDHGAYLNMAENTSEARRFLDRYACLLAVKWPKGYQPVMDVSFTPNVMLEAMICLTGDKSLSRFKQTGVIWGGPGGSSYHVLDSFYDGCSRVGINKGKNLFDVAKEELEKR